MTDNALTLALGLFALGTGVGKFLKEWNVEFIRMFGRALEVGAAITAGAWAVFAAVTHSNPGIGLWEQAVFAAVVLFFWVLFVLYGEVSGYLKPPS
ncbi:hypothetical protein [Mycolicibacterium sphagni]|uniref:Uncharacterized protein n=1 Tax=Mycolicibacterium sphagni TaxID=1786 RepID=A0A255DNV2_9MYCO|nr:hypothetical protein [Mycolicibacterium sphagni]OYN78905.1 hypothetical protein CG716_13635 [Mycolicibacterium sphagni]